jgi:CTP:molybdopterin cytidylyltransferase MocA
LRRAAIIFEGGAPAQNELQETITGLRHAITLDTVEKYKLAGLDEVILATNFPALGRAAERLGARVFDTRTAAPFHFGRVLQQVVRESGADGVIYMSGAALPLISQAEIAWVLEAMEQHAPCVVVNNLQSVDLVAWNPAHHVDRIEPPDNDNFLGWLLRETGMQRILIPNSAGIHFDLDTPTDFLTLGLSGLGGPRALAALKAVTWSAERLVAAAEVLTRDLPEVGVIGRVGTAIVDHINKNLRVRLRLFSEERGMKALGREEEGKVVSLVADMLEDMGPERFFRYVERICDAVFFDTRVLFANRGRKVTEWDRFHSDLGQVAQIRDPFVREFTRAALDCRVPVVLGGHSTVSGGLWLLADRAIALRGGPEASRAKGFAKT